MNIVQLTVSVMLLYCYGNRVLQRVRVSELIHPFTMDELWLLCTLELIPVVLPDHARG